MQDASNAAAPPLSTAPPLPPGPPPTTQWTADRFGTIHNQQDVPAISALLVREADAWRALMSLHSVTVQAAQQVAQSSTTSDALLTQEELGSASEAREAAYCAALTHLAYASDLLLNEALKLRALRRARRTVEVQALREIVRVHADESLAIGQHLSTNCAISIAEATTAIRVCIQQQRTQVSQLRQLIEVIERSKHTLPMSDNSQIVVGLCQEDSATVTLPVASVLEEVYATSRELNETSLSNALSRLFGGKAEHRESEPRYARRKALGEE